MYFNILIDPKQIVYLHINNIEDPCDIEPDNYFRKIGYALSDKIQSKIAGRGKIDTLNTHRHDI
jgi:hypothetical protein